MSEILYPTEIHREAVEVIQDFFLRQSNIDTILLVNSLARGKATPESDIDIAILGKQAINKIAITELENAWQVFLHSAPTLIRYQNSNRFAKVHLDIIDGRFEPAIWEVDGGIDFFEVEIGNRLLYSVPLAGMGGHVQKLILEWLPYYTTTLQVQRLKLIKEACLYNIEHIPFLVKRGLYFQAFDQLCIAFQKFLQALFIRYKTYPIAYNKWIKDQVVGILKLPELYKELPKIISVSNIESIEIIKNAEKLKFILDQYC
ncbi:MAG: nucleotidyltransferase domain-containing protein [Ferruginibacter sp.]